MRDLLCDSWITHGVGSSRHLFIVFLADESTNIDTKLAKLKNVWNIGDSALNLEDDVDQAFLSMASAFIAIHGCLEKLPRLLDARSVRPILDREDRVTTLLARVRRRHRMDWAGKWVVIRGGDYDGDVGFVRPGPAIWDVIGSRGSWVEVFVVPRVLHEPKLPDCMDTLNENGKRQTMGNTEGQVKRLRSERNPSVGRLDPRLLVDRTDLTLTTEGRDFQVYEEFGLRVFATDLELIRVRPRCLTLALMTPWPLRLKFQASDNSQIDKGALPPPTISKLEEDERVIHVPKRWVGYMIEWRGEDILAYSVTDGVREERLIPASETQKYFDVGEYVEVVIYSESSTEVAGSGWVIQNIRGSLLEIFAHHLTPEGYRGEASYTIIRHVAHC